MSKDFMNIDFLSDKFLYKIMHVFDVHELIKLYTIIIVDEGLARLQVQDSQC